MNGERVDIDGYRAWWAPPNESQEDLLAGDDSNLLCPPVLGGVPEFPECGPSTTDEKWLLADSKLRVSTRGRIQRKYKRGNGWGYKLTPTAPRGSSYAVAAWRGKIEHVHRIVFVTFCGAIPAGTTIDHKAPDRKFDNRLCNLRAATYKEQSLNRIHRKRGRSHDSLKRPVLCRPKNNPEQAWEWFESSNRAANVLNERKMKAQKFDTGGIAGVTHGKCTHHNGWIFKFADTITN